MFKKLMASVGIGAAKVDTLVHAETVIPGGELPITVVITAGDVEQTINGLTLALMTVAEVEYEDAEGEEHEGHEAICLASWELNSSYELVPGDEVQESLTLTIPEETPVTELDCRRNKTRVWLQTGLDIAMGRDGRDKDYLAVAPTPMVERIMAALSELGLELHSADVEKGQLTAREFRSTAGCYQELEFKPRGFGFRIKEVELSCIPEGDVTHVMLEVDRTFRGDALASFTLPNNLSQREIARRLDEVLG